MRWDGGRFVDFAVTDTLQRQQRDLTGVRSIPRERVRVLMLCTGTVHSEKTDDVIVQQPEAS